MRGFDAIIRCVIAFNWSLGGLAFCQALYSHDQLFLSACINELVRDDMIQAVGAGGEHSQDEFNRRSAEYRRKMTPTFVSGLVGWWLATVMLCVNALALVRIHKKPAAQGHFKPVQPAATNTA